MDFKIKFSGKGHDYTQEEIDTVVHAMKTAEPYTQGAYLKAFERNFCDYIGTNYAFAVNHATAALEMAAQLCQFQPGDEVIIPSHTFTSSAYPFVKKGAKIVWTDIDLQTRVVTVDTLAKKITPKTRAIVVVHLYGYAADMPDIVNLTKQHNILLIEDAAQAMGTSVDGKKSGAFGDIGIFSLHSHKNITTLGEGGVIVAIIPLSTCCTYRVVDRAPIRREGGALHPDARALRTHQHVGSERRVAARRMLSSRRGTLCEDLVRQLVRGGGGERRPAHLPVARRRGWRRRWRRRQWRRPLCWRK